MAATQEIFTDRREAGRRLAEQLAARVAGGPGTVVVGLPRGGVVAAAEVARALRAPLDVVVVRKLGVPWQPELAMGALGEDGTRVLNPAVVRHVSATDIETATAAERAELDRRVAAWRGPGAGEEVAGREVVLVDDGIATGATVRAAVAVLRARGAARIVLAVPVVAGDVAAALREEVDELIALAEPARLLAVGAWYEDFRQVTDAQVRDLLAEARRTERADREPAGSGPARVTTEPVPDPAPGPDRASGSPAPDRAPAEPRPDRASETPAPDRGTADPPTDPAPAGPSVRRYEAAVPSTAGPLPADVAMPAAAAGVVLFAHGSGSSRHSPRNRAVADLLHAAGLATVLLDLLTEAEAADRRRVFDIPLLADRLLAATSWTAAEPALHQFPLGYFGASTGAGAALWAAAERPARLRAVVSRGGRPDLAAPRLREVTAPTLLVVGERDTEVLALNRQAQAQLPGECDLAVVPGATHLFPEPGALEQAGALAADWFARHLVPAPT